MKIFLSLALLTVMVVVSAGVLVGSAAQMPGAGAPAEALDGMDPVLLVEGKEMPGRPAFSIVRGDFTYVFATAENKATFERAPEKYEIQLGGLCARMGGTTGANPSDFLVHDGKIYIFGSDECHRRFKASPAKYLPPVVPAPPAGRDAVVRGTRLLEGAARAIGDVKKLDSLTTFAETVTQSQNRPQGEATITTRTVWSFPDRARRERTMALAGKTMTSATVLSPAGMWFVGGPGQVYPMPKAGRASLDQDFGRHPVTLLRLRHAPGATAYATGTATVDGVRVRHVRFVRGGVDVTINLDDRDRIHSVSFHSRNADGEWGQYCVLYSDVRDVQGLQLPFVARALVGGAPDPVQSWTVKSIDLNPAADPALFAPAAPNVRQ